MTERWTEKYCKRCDSIKKANAFHLDHTGRSSSGLSCYCKECHRSLGKKYLSTDRGRHLNSVRYKKYRSDPGNEDRRRLLNRLRYHKMRGEILSAYGGCCRSCGCSDPRVLCIDHVKGDGKQDRNKHSPPDMLRRIIKGGFPDTYQILCRNCNWIKLHENRENPLYVSFKETG